MKYLPILFIAVSGFVVQLVSPEKLVAQKNDTVTLAVFKGPSAIGAVTVIDTPPKLPGNRTLTTTMVATPDLMIARLVAGDYSIAALPINMAAKLYNSGIPIQLAAIVGDGMLAFLSTDTQTTTLESLKGKKIYATGQGATPEFIFRKLLVSHGINPDKDVTLDFSLPYPELAAALSSGKAQYGILPEPFATMARMKNPQLKVTLSIGSLWTATTGESSYPMTAIVVTKKLMATDKESARLVLDAYKASIKFVNASPAQAGALAAKLAIGIDAKVAEKSIPLSAFVYRDAQSARSSVEATLQVLLDFSPASIGNKLPDSQFYLANIQN